MPRTRRRHRARPNAQACARRRYGAGGVNFGAPDGAQPVAQRSEGAALRFLRWLLEPPVGAQSTGLRVLRWVLRAVGWVLYAAFIGPDDGHGNAGVGRKGGKPGE